MGKYLAGIIMMCVLFFFVPGKVQAMDTLEEGKLDFTDLDHLLKTEGNGTEFSFTGLVDKLIQGDFQGLADVGSYVKTLLFQDLKAEKTTILQLFILLLVFALLNQFVGVFGKKELAVYGYYIFYLAIASLLLKSYVIINDVLVDTLEMLLDFMHALLPLFCVSLMFGSGQATAAGFYGLVLFVIYLAEWVFLYIGVPALHLYVAFQLANYAVGDRMFHRFLSLFKEFFGWGIKCVLGLVLGINAVQGLITPALDQFRKGSIMRVGSMIPGVGNTFGTVTEMILGSGVILKNAVGVGGMIVIAILAVGPMLKIGVMSVAYRLVAALAEPFGDRQMIGLINGVGEAAGLMLNMMLGAVGMFLITLAILTAASGRF